MFYGKAHSVFGHHYHFATEHRDCIPPDATYIAETDIHPILLHLRERKRFIRKRYEYAVWSVLRGDQQMPQHWRRGTTEVVDRTQRWLYLMQAIRMGTYYGPVVIFCPEDVLTGEATEFDPMTDGEVFVVEDLYGGAA